MRGLKSPNQIWCDLGMKAPSCEQMWEFLEVGTLRTWYRYLITYGIILKNSHVGPCAGGLSAKSAQPNVLHLGGVCIQP